MEKKQPEIESNCPVCIDTMISPCKLPCGHIFCYECLETILEIRPKCPMCREEIDPDDYKLHIDKKLYKILSNQNSDNFQQKEKDFIN